VSPVPTRRPDRGPSPKHPGGSGLRGARRAGLRRDESPDAPDRLLEPCQVPRPAWGGRDLGADSLCQDRVPGDRPDQPPRRVRRAKARIAQQQPPDVFPRRGFGLARRSTAHAGSTVNGRTIVPRTYPSSAVTEWPVQPLGVPVLGRSVRGSDMVTAGVVLTLGWLLSQPRQVPDVPGSVIDASVRQTVDAARQGPRQADAEDVVRTGGAVRPGRCVLSRRHCPTCSSTSWGARASDLEHLGGPGTSARVVSAVRSTLRTDVRGARDARSIDSQKSGPAKAPLGLAESHQCN